MRHLATVFGFLVALAGCQSSPSKNLSPTPPMGWNSWNTFQVRIDEKLIKETADAMIANGMRDAGYVYINLDDGWSEVSRDTAGNLVGDHARFPSGMKALGDYLHARGFKFGIYNCAGTKTCAGYPGGKDHEYQDAKTYASWGVDYLKYDWCNTEGMSPLNVYPKMREALDRTGRPIVFSMCEWGTSKPWTWAAHVGNLWRTTGDIEANWNSVKKIIDQQVGLEKYSGPDHWNDPDMLEVGNGSLTVAESRAHFSMWCMLSAPLIAGNDVRSMKPETLRTLTNPELIAIDQDPLGRQAFRAMVGDGYEIWARPLVNDEWAICLLNTGDSQVPVQLNWDDLTFLKHTYQPQSVVLPLKVGNTRSDLICEIPPHDVLVLRLRAETGISQPGIPAR